MHAHAYIHVHRNAHTNARTHPISCVTDQRWRGALPIAEHAGPGIHTPFKPKLSVKPRVHETKKETKGSTARSMTHAHEDDSSGSGAQQRAANASSCKSGALLDVVARTVAICRKLSRPMTRCYCHLTPLILRTVTETAVGRQTLTVTDPEKEKEYVS